MPLISVPAVYDGTNIALLEKPPSRTPYRVLVTFVEPVDAAGMRARNTDRLLGSFGAWREQPPARTPSSSRVATAAPESRRSTNSSFTFLSPGMARSGDGYTMGSGGPEFLRARFEWPDGQRGTEITQRRQRRLSRLPR